MLRLACALLCLFLAACRTAPSGWRVVSDADFLLGRDHTAARFEARLDELGARLERTSTPGEWLAVVPLPARPGYFPPRTLRVVYEVQSGVVQIKSADLASLGTHSSTGP